MALMSQEQQAFVLLHDAANDRYIHGGQNVAYQFLNDAVPNEPISIDFDCPNSVSNSHTIKFYICLRRL